MTEKLKASGGFALVEWSEGVEHQLGHFTELAQAQEAIPGSTWYANNGGTLHVYWTAHRGSVGGRTLHIHYYGVLSGE